MHSRSFVAAAVLALAGTAGAGAQRAPGTLKADIKGDGITGVVTLREVAAHSGVAADPKYPVGTKGVEVTVSVEGLKPGAHGVHLHAVGKCEAPGFTSAGGHFDPGPEGLTDPDANHPYHMGDLPNLVADAKGHAMMIAVTTRVTIADGPLTVLDADGTAVIIHANPDQGVTGEPKSGVSGGPRVACGVLVK